jgi:S1-C subfamily serine protease
MKTISIAAGCAALVAVGVYAFPALTADKAPEVQKLAPSAPRSLPSVPQSMGQVQMSFAPVVKRVAPAVVNVYSKTIVQAQANPFFNDPLFGQLFGTPEMRQRVQQSLGSGVIVRADGVIITNNHVVEGGSEITVALSDKREFKAKVLLADPRTDLAVLKIDTRGERLVSSRPWRAAKSRPATPRYSSRPMLQLTPATAAAHWSPPTASWRASTPPSIRAAAAASVSVLPFPPTWRGAWWKAWKAA